MKKWISTLVLFVIIGAVLFSGCTSQPEDEIKTEKQKTSTVGVPIEHIILKDYSEDLSQINKEGVLYLYNDPYGFVPAGMLFLNKDKWFKLEFEFEGIHFTNVQVKPNENGIMEITGNAEATSPSNAATWQFSLLSSSELKEEPIGSSGLFSILDENEDGVKDGVKSFKGVISGTNAQQNNGKVIVLLIRKLGRTD